MEQGEQRHSAMTDTTEMFFYKPALEQAPVLTWKTPSLNSAGLFQESIPAAPTNTLSQNRFHISGDPSFKPQLHFQTIEFVREGSEVIPSLLTASSLSCHL
ncbi:hypothetical protein AMECASPLE_012830 [Ameca splendens]|uniref:Uncharacterized protein n=1 Tax=Ameca splendens TaxID=208324 RepID=A0ABV0ZM53_9TELE